MSVSTVSNFYSFFKGNRSFKGVTELVGNPKEGEKQQVKCYTDKTELTMVDIQLHIDGNKSIGVSPIDEQGMVHFSVLDIDKYVNINKYVDAIYSYGIPLVPFYSKSGGLHLYVFYSEPTKPDDAKNVMNVLRTVLGLPANTEIFPKQRTKDASSYGSWINLPYFDAYDPENKRKLVDESHHLLPIDEALEYIRQHRTTAKEIYQKISDLPLSDAPPCLQSLYLLPPEDNRNNYLFSLAIYLKSKYEDTYEEELMAANEKLDQPLPEQEVRNTILKTMEKKTYSYKCGQAPLCDRCNKQLCEERQYGKSCDRIASLNFEEFHQYKTEPPYYEWLINGQPLRFLSESDIIDQRVFRELCLRKLHVLPKKLKDDKWSSIINKALENVVVHDVDITADVSTGGIWFRYTCDFFKAKGKAESVEQVLLSLVYRDVDLSCYLFQSSDYIEYIRSQKGFRAYSDVQLRINLMDIGCKQVDVSIKDNQMKLWAMPFEKIEKYLIDIKDIEVNYYVEEGDPYADKF